MQVPCTKYVPHPLTPAREWRTTSAAGPPRGLNLTVQPDTPTACGDCRDVDSEDTDRTAAGNCGGGPRTDHIQYCTVACIIIKGVAKLTLCLLCVVTSTAELPQAYHVSVHAHLYFGYQTQYVLSLKVL